MIPLKQLKLTAVMFMAGFALAAAYTMVGPGNHAFALHGSTILSTGVFDSNGAKIGDSIPTAVNTPSEFETMMSNALNGIAYTGVPVSGYNEYGAAFLIETMLHGQINYVESSAFLTNAKNDYPTWKKYVDAYSAAGAINWSYATTIATGSVNSTHVCNEGPIGACWDEAVYKNNNYNNGGTDAHNFQFYTMASPEASTLIIFTNPDGTKFEIRRECANVIGQVHPLTSGYDWTLTGTTTDSDTSLYPGETATFHNTVKNNGPYNADFTWYVRYCFDTCPGGYSSGYTQAQTGSVTNQASGATLAISPDWAYSPPDNTHTKICVWVAYTVASGPGTGAGNSTSQCSDILAPSSTCGTPSISPQPVGPTTSYTINSSVKVTGGLAGANSVNGVSNYYVKITGPNVNINNTNVTPVTTGTSGTFGTLSTSYTPGATNDVGIYTVTWGITGSVGTINCGPTTFTVAYSPYFSVVAGDIAAGPGFGNGSCGETSADIESWNNNTTGAPNYFGGGSELGALATGDITNFVSGLGLVGNASPPVTTSFIAPPNSGHGLSFANASNSETNTPKNYGGNAGTLPCIDDYFGTEDAANPSDAGTSQITNTTMSTWNGAYSADPDPTLNYVTLGDSAHNPITVNAGKTITLYVSGDVYIDSNIVYGSYTSTTIPRFNLYVSGNVYINPAVTELHGVYIAQASGSEPGDINTCATPTATPESYVTCSNKLLVVGSMAAEGQLKLERTHGNLAPVSATGVAAEPAEVFEYSPEMWLSAPPLTSLGVKSYTSLPPVF